MYIYMYIYIDVNEKEKYSRFLFSVDKVCSYTF